MKKQTRKRIRTLATTATLESQMLEQEIGDGENADIVEPATVIAAEIAESATKNEIPQETVVEEKKPKASRLSFFQRMKQTVTKGINLIEDAVSNVDE